EAGTALLRRRAGVAPVAYRAGIPGAAQGRVVGAPHQHRAAAPEGRQRGGIVAAKAGQGGVVQAHQLQRRRLPLGRGTPRQYQQQKKKDGRRRTATDHSGSSPEVATSVQLGSALSRSREKVHTSLTSSGPFCPANSARNATVISAWRPASEAPTMRASCRVLKAAGAASPRAAMALSKACATAGDRSGASAARSPAAKALTMRP